MEARWAQVPEYIELVTRWCKQNTRMPVIAEADPQHHRHPATPARAAKRGGADAVSLINTISSITRSISMISAPSR